MHHMKTPGEGPGVSNSYNGGQERMFPRAGRIQNPVASIRATKSLLDAIIPGGQFNIV